MQTDLFSAAPSADIPEGKKDKDWYKRYCQYLLGRGFNTAYQYNIYKINRNIAYNEGRQIGEEYKFLRELDENETLPAVWSNINTTKVKINTLIGNLISRAYKIGVEAINKEAKSKYLEHKYDIIAQKATRNDFLELEKVSGLPTVTKQQAEIPEEDAELDPYVKKTYKDLSEQCIEFALKFIQKRFNWDYWELQCFRDLMVTGACFSGNEMIEGVPRPVRYDPRNVGFDGWAKDEFLSDATYWFTNEYKGVDEVRQIYKLTDEEYDEVKNMNSYLPYSNIFGTNPYTVNTAGGFLNNGSVNVGLYRVLPDKSRRVLVTKYYWTDTRLEKFVKTVDKKGIEHFVRVKDTKKNVMSENGEQEIVERRVKTWRRATMIAGKVVKDYGEIENQVRSVDNFADCNPPVFGLIPDYIDGTWTSLYDMIAPLIDKINAAFYKIDVEVSKHVGLVIEYDISLLPEGWEHQEWLKALKRDGISFKQSVAAGWPSQRQSSSATVVDFGIGASVSQFLQLCAQYEMYIDKITGINDAMMGQTKASTLVGVADANLTAAKMSTERYFEMFNQFRERILNDLAGKVKLAFTDRTTFAPIIGDLGVDFMQEEIDILPKDYGVYCEVVPPILSDKQMFNSLITTAVSQGVFNDPNAMKNFYIAIDLLRTKDVNYAIDKFKTAVEKMERDAIIKQREQQVFEQQSKEQMAQQQQNAMLTQQQLKTQGQTQVESERAANKAELQRQKAEEEANKMILKAGLEQ